MKIRYPDDLSPFTHCFMEAMCGKEHMDESISFKFVNSDEATKIIGTKKPLGMFVGKISDNYFVTIDNSTGDAWTEPFSTEREAVRFLAGESAEFEYMAKKNQVATE